MSLLTWDEARPWAKAMAREVAAGAMPPWHASPDHGRFANDRRLRDEDRDALIAWVAAGAPAGDPARAPAPPSFGAGWTIGEPDLVIELPAEVTVPASGEVPYHDYVVDPGFEEDVWVRAAEARPGNRDVVHHIIVDYVIEDPLVRRRLARSGLDSRVQGSLGGYVPGDEPLVLGDGLARLIPAGAKIHFQMHYTPTGQVETDRSRLGLVLAKGPPLHEVRTGIASSPFIHIPAGSQRQDAPGRLHVRARERAAVDAPAPPPARQELRVPGPLSRRRRRDPAVGARLRLRLADLLRPRRAEGHAGRHAPGGDRRLGQLERQSRQSRSERRGVVGRADLGRDDDRVLRVLRESTGTRTR